MTTPLPRRRGDLSESGAYEVNSAYPDTRFAAHPSAEPQRRARTVARVTAATEVLVGGWLAVLPWVIGSGGSTLLRWNDVVAGLTLAGLALVRLVRPSRPRTPAITFALGAWAIVAAFVLSFQNGSADTAPLWNAIACGAALTAAAVWGTAETERATLRRP